MKAQELLAGDAPEALKAPRAKAGQLQLPPRGRARARKNLSQTCLRRQLRCQCRIACLRVHQGDHAVGVRHAEQVLASAQSGREVAEVALAHVYRGLGGSMPAICHTSAAFVRLPASDYLWTGSSHPKPILLFVGQYPRRPAHASPLLLPHAAECWSVDRVQVGRPRPGGFKARTTYCRQDRYEAAHAPNRSSLPVPTASTEQRNHRCRSWNADVALPRCHNLQRYLFVQWW